MSAENNGGKTSYYDLPVPTKETIYNILCDEDLSLDQTVDKLYELLPQTLNDLIEYKEMPFWRGEIFKATYALQERAKKSKSYSIIRELNKIIYYAGRGLAIAMREQK